MSTDDITGSFEVAPKNPSSVHPAKSEVLLVRYPNRTTKKIRSVRTVSILIEGKYLIKCTSIVDHPDEKNEEKIAESVASCSSNIS